MIEIELKESLRFNYEPQFLQGFLGEDTSVKINWAIAAEDHNYCLIQRMLYRTYKSDIHTYSVERKNAGEIISEVLAWRGLLIMPLALVFILLPFVEIFFKVDLIKARYTAPELDTLDFSLWIDIKRRFARTCDLHSEKVLNAALERIEDELDLVQILRKQAMMRRGISELDALEKRKDIFDCEFESDANADLLLIDEEPIGTKVMDNEQQADLSEEEDPSPLKETTSALVKMFDENETEVAMLAKGGKGYGSLWNMGTVCVLSAGLIVGLLLLGLLDVDNQFMTQTCLPSSEE